MSQSLNRRQLLGRSALGLALGATPWGQAAAAAVAAADPEAGPWWLLDPYAPGQEVGLGWRLGGLSALADGAHVLNLHHAEGGQARVHVCLRSARPGGAPRGVGHTELLDLILMDGGDGAAPTDEALGRVIRQLALVMGRNEARALEADDPRLAHLGQLLTHAERVARLGPERLL